MNSVSVNTPDGEFHLIIDDQEVVRASGFGSIAAVKQRLPEELRDATIRSLNDHRYASLIAAYYNGDCTALDAIPRQQAGTEFQTSVWRAISSVPFGTTVSYKELAELSGKPGAVRAAGTICGRNRLILLVPCHRILKSDGGIGSYLHGSEIKQSLLQREGAIL